MSLPAQHRHPVGLVDGSRVGTHLSVEEAGRHDIHTCKFSPFAGQGLAEMSHKGLGAVVDGLIRGSVDNARAHARRDDEDARALTLKDFADELRAIDDSVH